MEGGKLSINSNNSCLLCFKRIGEAKQSDYQQSLFPLQQLTHKLNLDLGNVFPGVVSRFGEDSSQRLGQLQLFCDLCESCTDCCKNIESGLLNGEDQCHAKILLDKMNKVELLGKYDWKTTPLGLIHFEIVERLRKEMMMMLSQLREKRKQTNYASGRFPKRIEADGISSQMLTRLMATQKVGETIKENPFENDIVITNILSFLKINCVKKCRFINKKWDSNCCRILKRIAYFSVELKLWKCSKSSLLELVSLIESGSQLPLASSVFAKSSFLKVLENEGNLLRYFSALATKLRYLSISVWCKEDVGDDINYPDGLLFPYLLDFHFSVITDSQRFPHFEFFKQIVQNSPKLEKISSYSMKVPTLFQPFVNLLRETRVCDRLTSLCLDYQGNLNSSQYDQLAEIGLNLKIFLAVPNENNVVGLSNFLKSQSESLEKLEVNFGYAQVEFERMPRLKELRIFNYWNMSYRPWNLNQLISYKKLFPVLEHLDLEGLNDTRKMEILLHSGRNEDDIGNSVKKLTLSDQSHSISSNSIENAAYLFPNLTELSAVPASLEILKPIFTKMRKLQDLTMDYSSEDNGNKCMDNLLMGVQLRGANCCCDLYFNPDESLLALSELRTLRLRISGNNIISDKVCRRVLMKMKALKLIRLCGLEEDEELTDIGISNTLLDEMRKMEKMVVIGDW